jgi:hypothetical protein
MVVVEALVLVGCFFDFVAGFFDALFDILTHFLERLIFGCALDLAATEHERRENERTNQQSTSEPTHPF